MVGGLERQYVETLAVPTLLARLAVIRRVDARRQRESLHAATLAARGAPEQVQQTSDALAEAAGDAPAMGGVEDLMRALGGQ